MKPTTIVAPLELAEYLYANTIVQAKVPTITPPSPLRRYAVPCECTVLMY